MRKVLKAGYGLLAAAALLLAAVLAAVFLAAVVLGGAAGASLSEFGGALAEWSIVVAAVAIVPGLVHIYLTGEHSLTSRTEKPGSSAGQDE